jgi:uncharacterized membrane protein YphA (DoxX/SURF4 family)
MGFAGLVELIGGLLIAFGLLTSYAAFIASGQMAVAYFKAHAAGSIRFSTGESWRCFTAFCSFTLPHKEPVDGVLMQW